MKTFTKKQVYVLSALVVSIPLIILFTIFLYDVFTVEVSYTFTAEVNITDAIGFDVRNDMLRFGRVPQDSPGATRFLHFKNNNSYPLYPEIRVYGDIAPMLSFNGSSVIEPHTEEEIQAILIPGSQPRGYYDGTVTVVLRKR